MNDNIFSTTYNKCNYWIKRDGEELDDIIDTSKITNEEIQKFLRNSQIGDIMWSNFLKEINLIDISYNNQNLLFPSNFHMYFDKQEKVYRRLFLAFVIYMIKKAKNKDCLIINEELTENNINEIIDSHTSWFRGQTEATWGLIPSILRDNNFINKDFDGDLVNLNRLFDLYNSSNLINKYKSSILLDFSLPKIDDINYDFISYMQHSVSYSPFIDFTKKGYIGVNFALGNKNSFNKFKGVSSKVFVLNFAEDRSLLLNKDEVDKFIKSEDFKIIILNKKIEIGKIMKIIDVNNKEIELDFTCMEKLLDYLRPKYKIIDIPTNDRMKYQHGTFILFYDFVLYNNRILFELAKDFSISTYIIQPNKKDIILKKIEKAHPESQLNYLLNPYDYFGK